MSQDAAREVAALHRLARRWGVATRYRDGSGALRRPPPETLLAVLAASGSPVEAMADVPEALAIRRRQQGTRLLPSSAVAWAGVCPVLPLHLPADAAEAPLEGRLILEQGETVSFRVEAADAPATAGRRLDGGDWVRRRLRLADPIPEGYHRLEIEAAGRQGAMRLVSAPLAAHPHPDRAWGVFLPLQALRAHRGGGLGDLTLLGRLVRWAGERGAAAVGCMPLLAGFLDAGRRPFEPNPALPASRLFWNELWADLSAVPELPECRAAREVLSASDTVALRRTLREGEGAHRVDPGAERGWRRPVWQALADHFFTRGAERRRDQLRRLLDERPELEAYAAFRAAGDRLGTPWQEWPQEWAEPVRQGEIPQEADSFSDQPGLVRLHLYAQLVVHQQMAGLRARIADTGADLFFDLPLGVHTSSYDVWRHRSLFVPGVTVGAPPDAFSVRGRSWGISPLSPERLREEGPAHFRAVLAHTMGVAGVIRLEHAMQLERLFWIPAGVEPRDGTYVRYPREELLATLVLESRRHRCAVVAEDPGTVSEGLRRAAERHGLRTTFVLPFELRANPFEALNPVPEGALAALGTHETATFAGFWHGRDLAARGETGPLSADPPERPAGERRVLLHALVAFLRSQGCLSRVGEPGPEQVARAALEFLAGSPAGWVQVDLEDLWAEHEPEETPPAGAEPPRWRRRARKTLADLESERELSDFLEHLDRLRRLSGSADPGIELTGEEGFMA